MTQVDISGITVEFPFEPYPCQVEYMVKVVECLEKGWNGVLESPTGTGKTLCLLCASLAWLSSKQAIQKQAMANMAAGGGTNFTGENMSVAEYGLPGEMLDKIGLKLPQIIYTSRTHTQLSQVVKELNKTVYKDKFRVAILGSRDQLCVHPDVASEGNASLKGILCRAKVDANACIYYQTYNRNRGGKLRLRPGADVLDIEDLAKKGRLERTCPFYQARDAQETADLILMPYNYVIDSSVRRMNKTNLAGAVVIFDEAHNLQSICEDAASVELSSRDVAVCLTDCQKALEIIKKEREEVRSLMDESEQPFGEHDGTLTEVERGVSEKELAHLIVLLHQLEKVLDNLDITERSANGIVGMVRPGEYMYELFSQAGIEHTMVLRLSACIDALIAYLGVKQSQPGPLSRIRVDTIRNFGRVLESVFLAEDENGGKTLVTRGHEGRMTKCFRVYIHQEDPQQARFGQKAQKAPQATNLWMSKGGPSFEPPLKKPGWVANYWCFSAGPTMAQIVERGTRSLIITSGTLAPLDSFRAEMRVPLPIKLENQHVINGTQIFAGILCKGPDGKDLNGSFATRSGRDYLKSLGNCLVNIFRAVPQGLLVFFSSYSHMSDSLEFFKSTSNIWQRLVELKPVFVEAKDKHSHSQVMTNFEAAVTENGRRGAALFAVCKGKVSEGLDFADSHGRAVVVVGIPYPPYKDSRVVLKRRYLAETMLERKKHPQKSQSTSTESEVGLLSDQAWYSLEAARSVNQAIGRVIRHKDDFGAIILVDSRYSAWDKTKFPSWTRKYITNFRGFGPMVGALTSFYRSHGMGYSTAAQNANLPLAQQKGPALEFKEKRYRERAFASKLNANPQMTSTQCVVPCGSDEPPATVDWVGRQRRPCAPDRMRRQPVDLTRESSPENPPMPGAVARQGSVLDELCCGKILTPCCPPSTSANGSLTSIDSCASPLFPLAEAVVTNERTKRKRLIVTSNVNNIPDEPAPEEPVPTEVPHVNQLHPTLKRLRTEKVDVKGIASLMKSQLKPDVAAQLRVSLRNYRDSNQPEPLWETVKKFLVPHHLEILKEFATLVRAEHKDLFHAEFREVLGQTL